MRSRDYSRSYTWQSKSRFPAHSPFIKSPEFQRHIVRCIYIYNQYDANFPRRRRRRRVVDNANAARDARAHFFPGLAPYHKAVRSSGEFY